MLKSIGSEKDINLFLLEPVPFSFSSSLILAFKFFVKKKKPTTQKKAKHKIQIMYLHCI